MDLERRIPRRQRDGEGVCHDGWSVRGPEFSVPNIYSDNHLISNLLYFLSLRSGHTPRPKFSKFCLEVLLLFPLSTRYTVSGARGA
jgi:hypothetical protein